jgi:dimethylargininase
MPNYALVRKPGKNFAGGITTSGLGKPDFRKALAQHEAYCEALKVCGLELIILDADDRYPDSCFVEDTAVVLDEAAVITRPGAESRRGEEEAIAEVLSGYRKILRILPPGTLDGGDILTADNHFYIGRSARTNSDGSAQFADYLARFGYTSSEIHVNEGLHLKSGLEYLGEGNYISTSQFSGMIKAEKCVLLNTEDSYAANCLLVNGRLLIPKGFPRSKEKVLELGYAVLEVEMSEFRKMDGGLTCLSLIF